jgi:hypothetical protein
MRETLPIVLAALIITCCAKVEEEGYDAGLDVPADTLTDTGWDTVHDPGWDTAYDPGMDTPADPGMDTGADPDLDTGSDPVFDTTDPGTDPGYDPGTDPGTDPGSDPGPDGPSGTVWCVPDPPTSCTSYPYGCCSLDRLNVHCYAGMDITYSCYGGMIGLCGPSTGGYMDCI